MSTTPPAPSALQLDHRRENRKALARLLLVISALVLIAVLLHGLAVLVVVLALVVMVMTHEGGHFVTAKLSGMKVTEYFLGFGPRLWSVRRGETEYGVKAIPAGGYVRITGMTSLEEVPEEDEPRSYRQATFPRRLLVAVAGSAMHFVMAFFLLWGLVAFSGLSVPTKLTVIDSTTNFVHVTSPARRAGLRAGDEIEAVNGRTVDETQLISAVRSSVGKPVRLTVLRHGRTLHLLVTPVDGRKVNELVCGRPTPAVSGKKPTGLIGVTLSSVTRQVTENPFSALGKAGTMLGSATAATSDGIADVFSLHGLRSFAHQVVSARHNSGNGTCVAGAASSSSSNSQILSIYGAARLGVQAAQHNVSLLLYILVAINLFVGMVNLFPMLPLDGGHVAIAVYERIRSRNGRRYHADVTKLLPATYIFLAFLVLLGVGALYANIVQPPNLGGG